MSAQAVVVSGSINTTVAPVANTIGPITFQGTITPSHSSGTAALGTLASAGAVFTAFTVPAGAIGCIITPPPIAASGNTALLCRIGYDVASTGQYLPLITPSILTWDPSNIPAKLFIGGIGAISGTIDIYWF